MPGYLFHILMNMHYPAGFFYPPEYLSHLEYLNSQVISVRLSLLYSLIVDKCSQHHFVIIFKHPTWTHVTSFKNVATVVKNKY